MKSKTQHLLEHLKAGKSVTPWVAWSRFHIYRLSSVICKLRRRGLNIVTDSVSKNGVTFAKYYIGKS